MKKNLNINQIAQQYIRELELELMEYAWTGSDINEMPPLTEPRYISNMIYNLLVSKRWQSKLSGTIYSEITTILFNRLKNEKTNTEGRTEHLP